MAARLPTFADLGFNDPRVVTPGVTVPASDPGAIAMGKLGAGLQQAGGVALRIAAKNEDDRQALNDASATTDFINRIVPLRTKISLSNDPSEIGELRQQYDTLLQTSSSAIDDPQRRALWLSRHSNALLHAQGEADERITGLDRQNYGVGIERQLDGLLDNAKSSPDGRALDVAKMAGQTLIDAAGKYGLPAQWVYQQQRRFEEKLGRLEEKHATRSLADSIWGGSDKGFAGVRGGVTSAGGRIDFSAARQLAVDVGFKGENADKMAAISLAESGGNPDAVGDRDLGGSYGLTQIHEPAHGPVAREAKGNPRRAMELAYDVSKGGTDFSPWTMYKNRSYLKYMPKVSGDTEKEIQRSELPPGVKLNSQGRPYSVSLDNMSPQARANDAASMRAIRAGRDGGDRGTFGDAVAESDRTTRRDVETRQFDGGTAPLPNIDAMLSRVQESAERGEISQDQANTVMSDLRGRYNRLHSAQATQRAALAKQISNGAAMLEDGREFDYDPGLIRHYWPKEKADEIIQQLDDARDGGQILSGIRTAAPEQIAQQRAEMAAGLTDPNATNYAKRRKMLDLFDRGLVARQKALTDDPAGYVSQYSPNVAGLLAAVDHKEPGSFANYATATLAEQERLGVPAESRSVLPEPAAKRIAARIAAIDPAKENPAQVMAEIARSYGAGTLSDYWPQVFGDLVKAKLPSTYQVLATMPPDSVAAGDLVRATQLLAEKGGMSALKKAVPDVTQKAIDKGLDETLENFRESVGYQSGGAKLYATVRDATQALAYYYGFRGRSDSEAVRAAVDGVLNDKYDFDRIDGTMVRVPKGAMATVDRAAGVVKRGISADDLGPVPGNELLTPDQRKEVWLGAIQNGGWANNKDDTGLVLMGRFRNGALSAVRRADGSLIELKFDSAPALAAAAPAEIAPTPGMLGGPARASRWPTGASPPLLPMQ